MHCRPVLGSKLLINSYILTLGQKALPKEFIVELGRTEHVAKELCHFRRVRGHALVLQNEEKEIIEYLSTTGNGAHAYPVLLDLGVKRRVCYKGRVT